MVLIHNFQVTDYYYKDQLWIGEATRKTKKISYDRTKKILDSENLSNPQKMLVKESVSKCFLKY